MQDNLKEISVERGEMPIEWFDSSPAPKIQDKGMYKVHNDGSHFVGVLMSPNVYSPPPPKSLRKKILNEYLDAHIQQAVADNCKGAVLQHRVKQKLAEEHPEVENAEEVVKQRVKEKYHNLHNRKKRFMRKAYLNRWNYFVTITYSDDKMTGEQFRKKLKKCLCNLSSRNCWRYMGVFEKAPVTERLHFHALMYVPSGEMVGDIQECKDYSTERHEMQITHSNTFFEKRFGRNDFEELDDIKIRKGNTLNYLLKYIGKSDEKIIYSKGIKDHICMELENKDIACGMLNTEKTYVLFDGKVDWEKDVMRYKNKQASIFDDKA